MRGIPNGGADLPQYIAGRVALLSWDFASQM
jgi:hypothetical protein